MLVVEDELRMQRLLHAMLSTTGLRTDVVTLGAEAIERAANGNQDLILLDLGLPDYDGIELIRRLRAHMTAPIIVVSGRGHEQDGVAVLDAGANDYLMKPFSHAELLARIRVWLRQTPRAVPGRDEWIIVGDLRLDLSQRLVDVGGREVHLTPTEYKLFETLMRNAGRVLTYRRLLEATWGPSHGLETQHLRVYIRFLRRKLEPDAARPRYLFTEHGVGYRLRAAELGA